MSSSFSLSAHKLIKFFGDQKVLGGASISVGPATRAGLIGPNGCGKTTLLKILAGLQVADSGRVRRSPPELSVGYLPQEMARDLQESARAYLQRRTGLAAAVGELALQAERLAEGSGNRAAHDYSRALDRFLARGGSDLEQRLPRVLPRVGLDPGRLDHPVSTFSEGQASRLALASILLSTHEVLLLDEPTNNLDFEGLEILEGFLRKWSGGLVVVSHDRAFLDQVVTEIVEITEPDHGTSVYQGGFSEYEQAREQERARRYAAHRAYTEQREGLLDRLRREEQWAARGVRRQKRNPKDKNKVARDAAIAAAENRASKKKVLETRLQKLEAKSKPWEGWELQMNLDPVGRSGDLVLALEDAVIRRGSFTLGPISLDLHWQDRLAISGRNGSGKSTLLGALLGRIPLERGGRRMGSRIVLGEVDQRRAGFAEDAGLIETFCGVTSLPREQARSLLAKFGLTGEHVVRPVATLSPGERTRAHLAALMARGVNCLFLDEPTNHLDLPAIEELEKALGAFEGTLVFVTHDRRLLQRLQPTNTVELG